MAIVAFPSSVRRPSSATITLLGMTQSATSPFDGSVQTLEQPGAKWHATLTWQAMLPADWRPLMAFITSLRGRAGRFYYNHPMTWRRATAAIGTPLVNGAGQSGLALTTDGWTHSAAIVLAGDFFSYVDSASRTRLHQITADGGSDGSGNAVLAISPPLRAPPPDNAALELVAPSCVWMLNSDDQGQFGQDGKNAARGTVSLDIVEALV